MRNTQSASQLASETIVKTAAPKRRISIVIPVYYEERTIATCISKSISFFNTSEAIDDYEIIIVADKSGDATIDIIKAAKKNTPKLRLIVNETRLEKGGSIRQGMLNATKGDLLLYYDADLATPLCELDKLMAHVGPYDVVVGSRALKGARVRKGLIKRMVSGTLSLINTRVMGLHIKDTQCGFKLFTARCRELFEKLTIRSSAFDIELLYLAKKRGFRMKEVPVDWLDSGTSNFNQAKVVFHFIRDLVRIRWNELMGIYA